MFVSLLARQRQQFMDDKQSSVYCFYDPDYRALALGKLTALKETEFVRQVRPLDAPDILPIDGREYLCPHLSV